MTRYALNLPAPLKKEAEQWAARQGVSLNQFILWPVAEKVEALKQHLDDPPFPRITYRRGAAGQPRPALRGTGVHVQALVLAARHWEMTPERLAGEYDLSGAQVEEALAFYEAHREEIDAAIAAEQGVEAGWAWNWPGFRFNVVAYPSVVYGKKPWFPNSTTPSLPRRIGELECLWADFEAGREGKGNGNLAFDLWVTEEEAAGPESVTREVMIWLWHQGMRPAGRRVASLSLDGREADLWRQEGHEDPNGLVWTLLTFVYESEVTEGPLDLRAHLDYLVENGYLSAEEYLADVELGNEVVSGYGRTTLRGYGVRVCGR
jgi:uncharacterized protein (DUF433 family)